MDSAVEAMNMTSLSSLIILLLLTGAVDLVLLAAEETAKAVPTFESMI
jgi:hypothetical protein